MRVSSFYGFLKKGFGRAEAGLCLLVLLYAVCGAAVAAHVGQLRNFKPLLYSDAVGLVTLFLGLAFVAGRVAYVIVKKRPERLTAFLVQDLRDFLTKDDRLARALPVFASFIIFISVFTSLKLMIPAVNPFSWDQTFMKWDNVLHGGIDPWRLLQPLMGYPAVTMVVNVVYNCWFIVMFSILYWQLFSVRDPTLRMRFFYAFILNWILNGTVLAMIFSSAGPCFYHGVTGLDYFEPQMSYLWQVAQHGYAPAISTQDMLWRSYKETGIGIGVGISAMPSVHVSSAFLFMLIGWKAGRLPGILLTAFFLFILLGSVHLAWHYAIDGYAGCLVAAALWWSLPFLLRRLNPVALVNQRIG
jgi:hypothetical protein